MKKILLIVLLGLLFAQSSHAQRQSFDGYMEAGDAATAQDDYYSAYQFYRIAGEFAGHADDPEMLFKLGESAIKTRAYEVGRSALLQLAATDAAAEYPLLNFYLGEAYYFRGQYDESVAAFDEYLNNPSGVKGPEAEIAIRRKASANWAIDEKEEDDDFLFEHLGTEVNSEYSEVAYTLSPDGSRLYTTNRFPFKTDTLNPRRKLSKVVRQDGTPASAPLPETINVEGKLVAHSAFHPDGNRVYFSQCTYIDYDQVRCGLYTAEVSASGEWMNPIELTGLNDTAYTTQMPNVGRSVDGSHYLYFSSNRPGGAGAMDLYRAPIREDGTPGTAENLTALNTAGNDVTPFYYAPLRMLYFSTDGANTFGGLDVHKSYEADEGFRDAINLGSLVNSSYDDAYYTRFESEEKAYVSSTRQSPEAVYYGEEKEVCCYDVYRFEPDDRVDLLVRTFNGLTEKELMGTTVTLFERTPEGLIPVEEILLMEGRDEDGVYFQLDEGKQYEVWGTKDGFSDAMAVIDLTDPEMIGVPLIRQDLYLNPTIDLDVFTFNNNDKSVLDGATVGIYRVDENGNETLFAEATNPNGNDFSFPLEIGSLYRIKGTRPGFGDAFEEVDLRDFSGDASLRIKRDLYLGQLLEILVVDGVTGEPLTNATVDLSAVGGSPIGKQTNPTGNDFLFTVNLNEPFVVNTTRDEYRPSRDTLEFTLADLDRGGGKLQFTVPLFAADINRLLPTEVFFDNDHPDPRSYGRTTRLSYEQTYYPYANRRDTFIKEFIAPLDQEDAFVTRLRYRDFFDLQVDGGWKQLQALATALEGYLEDGNRITLLVQGSASPRAGSDYNYRLSQRRIVSVINYFRSQNDEALLPYIRSGQLSFERDARGETSDPSEVSDRLDDPRQSVFSLAASLDRRVRITNAEEEASSRK